MGTEATSKNIGPEEPKKAGRPRSEESTQAILDATWALMLNKSLQDISIEAIAKVSGVGKATIYRWWPSKCALVIDTIIDKVPPELEFPECQSAAESIKKQMQALIKAFAGDYGRILGEIIAESQACPERLENFRKNFIYKRRETVKAIIEKGIRNGEFSKCLDIDLAVDVLYGAIFYRLLVKHLPLDQAFAEQLPEFALKVIK